MNNNNGENLETPTGSQPGIITTEPEVPVNPQGAVITESPEEVEFNALKGGTQDRIKTILTERDQIKAENERLKAFVSNQTPQGFTQAPGQNDLSNPQVRDAVSQLDKVGMATKSWAEEEINKRVGGLIYNIELNNLEKALDGSDGTPKFERSEYQDFVNKNPKYSNYDPKDVYNIMYSEEIMDAKLKSRSGQPTQPSSSLRPVKTTVREEQWTPESIELRLKESDGPDWYLANKGLINKVLATPQS